MENLLLLTLKLLAPLATVPVKCKLTASTRSLKPRGGTRNIHDGDVRRIIFYWVENLHAWYFFGSRDLSRIFLGLKKIRIFFWVLSPSELFVSGFRCDKWIRKIFIRTFFQRRVFRVLVFFGLEILMPGIFLGLKFQACVFFWVCNMKLCRIPPPPSCILRVPPWALKLYFCVLKLKRLKFQDARIEKTRSSNIQTQNRSSRKRFIS